MLFLDALRTLWRAYLPEGFWTPLHVLKETL